MNKIPVLSNQIPGQGYTILAVVALLMLAGGLQAATLLEAAPQEHRNN